MTARFVLRHWPCALLFTVAGGTRISRVLRWIPVSSRRYHFLCTFACSWRTPVGFVMSEVFSGRQPRQGIYKVQRFGDEAHLHYQGDEILIQRFGDNSMSIIRTIISVISSPWWWRWSLSPKLWILKIPWLCCLPEKPLLSSVALKTSWIRHACASVSLFGMYQLGSHWTDFLEFLYQPLSLKCVHEMKIWLISDKNIGQCTWRALNLGKATLAPLTWASWNDAHIRSCTC